MNTSDICAPEVQLKAVAYQRSSLINAPHEDIPAAIPSLIGAAMASCDADRDNSRRCLLRASTLIRVKRGAHTRAESARRSESQGGLLAWQLNRVIDDDVSERQSLDLPIQSAGWQPEVFACAQEFLSRPRVLAPSCLLLEVALPDLNGLDLRRLVADRIEMPVIFITAYADVSTTVRVMKAGAVEFLTKPFRDEVLLSSMQDAIERSHDRSC